jgi:hypothetical protein
MTWDVYNTSAVRRNSEQLEQEIATLIENMGFCKKYIGVGIGDVRQED